MDGLDKWRLRRNRVALLELDADVMCGYLIEAGIFTPDDMEEITHKDTSKNKMSALLTKLERKGPKAYKAFKDAILKNEVRKDLVKKLDDTDTKDMPEKLKRASQQLAESDEPDNQEVFVHVPAGGGASTVAVTTEEWEDETESKNKRQKKSSVEGIFIKGDNNTVISGGSQITINNFRSKSKNS